MGGLGNPGKPPDMQGLDAILAAAQLAHHVIAFVKAKKASYIVLLYSGHVHRVAALSRGVEGISWVSGARLSEFVAHSNAQTEQQLLEVFDFMPDTGMKYIIYNLRYQMDFDVRSDPYDVRVAIEEADLVARQSTAARVSARIFRVFCQHIDHVIYDSTIFRVCVSCQQHRRCC